MTLAEVSRIGCYANHASMAEFLRHVADDIEKPDTAPIRQIVMLTEYQDGSIDRNVLGLPCDFAHFVGILTIAAHLAMDELE